MRARKKEVLGCTLSQRDEDEDKANEGQKKEICGYTSL